MKSRRQKDPKSRRRGLQASTMIANRYDDDEENQDAVSQQCPTASRNVDAGVKPSDEEEDDEKIRQKKEEHRRNRGKKSKVTKKTNAANTDTTNNIEVEEEIDDNPLKLPDNHLTKSLQAAKAMHQQENVKALAELMEKSKPVPEFNKKSKAVSEDSSDDDKRKKKKKNKHKKKKSKKSKKQKRRYSDSDDKHSDKGFSEHSAVEEKQPENLQEDSADKNVLDNQPRAKSVRSRSNSYSSMSMSSISSAFSDSFDFAEGDFQLGMPQGEVDASMMDSQRSGRGGAMFRGGFRGRGGFDPFMRGRGVFRGHPQGMRGARGRGGRGAFRGRGGWGYDGSEGVDGSQAPGAFRGCGGRGGIWGRGGMWGPGFGGRLGYDEIPDPGMGIHVVDSPTSKRSGSTYTYSSDSRSSSSYYRSRRRRRRRRSSYSSSYSRSSRSYSRSSRSSRSRTRSRSRRSSGSSYSKSSRSRSRTAEGWTSEDESRRRDQTSLGDPSTVKVEEVQWWKELENVCDKQNNLIVAVGENNAPVEKKVDGDDIAVVNLMLSVVDKVIQTQDPIFDTTRKCLSDTVAKAVANVDGTQVNLVPELPTVADVHCNKLIKIYDHASKFVCKSRSKIATANKTKPAATTDAVTSGKRISSEKADKRKGRGRKRRRHRRRKRGHRSSSYSSRSRSSSSSSGSSTPRSRQKTPPKLNLPSANEEVNKLRQSLLETLEKLDHKQLNNVLLQSTASGTNAASVVPALIQASVVASSNAIEAEKPIKKSTDFNNVLWNRLKQQPKAPLEGDSSPTFLSRNKDLDTANDKIFSGTGNLKSRKIFISTDLGKAIPLTESNMFDDTQPMAKKGDTSWMNIESKNEPKVDKQLGQLFAYAEEQKQLKEEASKKLREDIEKAERAKKEQMKNEIIAKEMQKEIEAFRLNARKEIEREILSELKIKGIIPNHEEGASSSIRNKDGLISENQQAAYPGMNQYMAQNGKQFSEMSEDDRRKYQDWYSKGCSQTQWTGVGDNAGRKSGFNNDLRPHQLNTPNATNMESSVGNVKPTKQIHVIDDASRYQNPKSDMVSRGNPVNMARPMDAGIRGRGQMDYGNNRPDVMPRPSSGSSNVTRGQIIPGSMPIRGPVGGLMRPGPFDGQMRPSAPGGAVDNRNMHQHMHHHNVPMHPGGPHQPGQMRLNRPMENSMRPNGLMHPGRAMDGHIRPNGPIDNRSQHFGPNSVRHDSRDRMDGFKYGPEGRQDHHVRHHNDINHPQQFSQPRFNNPGASGNIYAPPPYGMDQRGGPPVPAVAVQPNQFAIQQQHQPQRYYNPSTNIVLPQQHMQQVSSQMHQSSTNSGIEIAVNKVEDCAPGTTPPSGATAHNDQPPPPGDENEELLPVVQKTVLPSNLVKINVTNLDRSVEDQEEPSGKSTKKKKKKNKKHRKKRRHSSSSEEDDTDKAKRLVIMEQLKRFQEDKAAEDDIEDGEVQSDVEEETTDKKQSLKGIYDMLADLEAKKKKKRKKDKKNKRKRRESTSEEESVKETEYPGSNTNVASKDESIMNKTVVNSTVPPSYHNEETHTNNYHSTNYHQEQDSYNQQFSDHKQQQQPRLYNDNADPSRLPTTASASSYRERPTDVGHHGSVDKYRPYSVDHRHPSHSYGGDETSHAVPHQHIDKFVPGPEGDHGQVSSSHPSHRRSPLPFAVHDDPNNLELRRMEKRYNDSKNMKQMMEKSPRDSERMLHHDPHRVTPHDPHRKRPPGMVGVDQGGHAQKRRKIGNYHEWDRTKNDDPMHFYGPGSPGSILDGKEGMNRKDVSERYPGNPINVTSTRRNSPPHPSMKQHDWIKRAAPTANQIPVIGSTAKPNPQIPLPQPIPTLSTSNRQGGGSQFQPMRPQMDYYHRGGPPAGPQRYDQMAGGRPRDDKIPFNETEISMGGARVPFHQQQQHRPAMMGNNQMMPRHHGPSGRLLEPMPPVQPNRQHHGHFPFDPQGRRPPYN